MHSDSTPAIDGCAFIRIGDHVTLVDQEVASGLSGREFRVAGGYAQMLTSSGRWASLARLIVKPKSGMYVDHVNGVKLDNRRVNLRPLTPAENAVNRRKCKRTTTSRFKGVYWDATLGQWVAQIKHRGRQVVIGRFKTEERAAEAYDAMAFSYWGDKACLNFGNPLTGSTAVDLCRDQLPVPVR